jgi:hypothetical protein
MVEGLTLGNPTYFSNFFLTLSFLRYNLILAMPLNPSSSDHHAQKLNSLGTRQFTRILKLRQSKITIMIRVVSVRKLLKLSVR